MKALGLIEVYSFSTAVCVADVAAKAADVKIIAMDRNRPLSKSAPAPLVMVVKIEGSVSAVRAAVDAGVSYAKEKERYIVSHVIPNPGESVDKMAYLMDINRDKYSKNMPKSFLNAEIPPINPHGAYGILEVQGLVTSIEGLDAMLKAAEVRLIHTEKRLGGGGSVTMMITGSVSAVKAAVEAGLKTAKSLGKVFGAEVIAAPHDEIAKFFSVG